MKKPKNLSECISLWYKIKKENGNVHYMANYGVWDEKIHPNAKLIIFGKDVKSVDYWWSSGEEFDPIEGVNSPDRVYHADITMVKTGFVSDFLTFESGNPYNGPKTGSSSEFSAQLDEPDVYMAVRYISTNGSSPVIAYEFIISDLVIEDGVKNEI